MVNPLPRIMLYAGLMRLCVKPISPNRKHTGGLSAQIQAVAPGKWALLPAGRYLVVSYKEFVLKAPSVNPQFLGDESQWHKRSPCSTSDQVLSFRENRNHL